MQPIRTVTKFTNLPVSILTVLVFRVLDNRYLGFQSLKNTTYHIGLDVRSKLGELGTYSTVLIIVAFISKVF